MKNRNYGEVPSLECRHDSHEKTDKQKRYRQILNCLKGRQMTAKEIAVELFAIGYSETADRNVTAPRLNELCKIGLVEQVGKKRCDYTGRTVTVYEVRG